MLADKAIITSYDLALQSIYTIAETIRLQMWVRLLACNANVILLACRP